MKGVLAWLWHQHHWETIDKRELMHVKDSYRIGIVYILKCKDCGDVTFRSWT